MAKSYIVIEADRFLDDPRVKRCRTKNCKHNRKVNRDGETLYICGCVDIGIDENCQCSKFEKKPEGAGD